MSWFSNYFPQNFQDIAPVLPPLLIAFFYTQSCFLSLEPLRILLSAQFYNFMKHFSFFLIYQVLGYFFTQILIPSNSGEIFLCSTLVTLCLLACFLSEILLVCTEPYRLIPYHLVNFSSHLLSFLNLFSISVEFFKFLL